MNTHMIAKPKSQHFNIKTFECCSYLLFYYDYLNFDKFKNSKTAAEHFILTRQPNCTMSFIFCSPATTNMFIISPVNFTVHHRRNDVSKMTNDCQVVCHFSAGEHSWTFQAICLSVCLSVTEHLMMLNVTRHLCFDQSMQQHVVS